MGNLRYVGPDPTAPDSVAKKKDIVVADATDTIKGVIKLPGYSNIATDDPFYTYGLIGGTADAPHTMYVSYLVKAFSEWGNQLFNSPADGEWEIKREGVEAPFEATLAKADNSVQKTGNETVAGIKTFSSSPTAPMPTASNQVAIKLYADSKYADAQTYVDNRAVMNPPGRHLTLWIGNQAEYTALGSWDIETVYVIV